MMRAGDYERDECSGLIVRRRRGVLHARPQFMHGPAFFGGGDPFFSSVSLLLHGDGTNGSTTFTDSSGTPKTVVVSGNAQISTAWSAVGSASMKFDGTGDFAGMGTGMALGTGNFTIEGWLNASTLDHVVASSRYNGGGANNYWYINIAADGTFGIQSRTTGGTQYYAKTAAGVISTATKYHFACTRASGVLRVFVDGTLGTGASDNDGSNNLAETGLAIGLFNYTGFVDYFNGYIDDFRITLGVARYTASFTKPSAPYPNY